MDKFTLTSAINVGEVFFKNPQKGTSTITAITNKHIEYIRGKSKIRLPVDVFLSVVKDFSGKKCSSADLRSYMPDVFDSHSNSGPKGHSCNCTFLFCIAKKLNLIEGGIQGRGVACNPYYVVFR